MRSIRETQAGALHRANIEKAAAVATRQPFKGSGQQPAGQEMQGRGMQGQGMQGRGMKGRGMQKRQGMQDGEGMQGGCKMHRRGMSEQ